MENLVYRISGHESSSTCASATEVKIQELSGHKSLRRTEYIRIPAPVTPVDELAYLRPECTHKYDLEIN